MRYEDNLILNDIMSEYELKIRFEIESKIIMNAITTNADDHIIKVNNVLTCNGLLVCRINEQDRYCEELGNEIGIYWRDAVSANEVLDVQYECNGKLRDNTVYMIQLHGTIQDTASADQYYFQSESSIVKMVNDNDYLTSINVEYLTTISQQLNVISL